MTSSNDEGSNTADDSQSDVWFVRNDFDLAVVAPAFGGPSNAQAVFDALRDVYRQVRRDEREHVDSVGFYAQQCIALIMRKPSLENGNHLHEFVNRMRGSMEIRATWPTVATADSRIGTVLERMDRFVFEHESEGLIRLEWVNPMPKPPFLSLDGIQCDVCLGLNLQNGYQHVDEDNERDSSAFLRNRIGFDVCAECAKEHILQRRDAFRAWVRGVPRGDHRRLLHPSAATGAPPELHLAVCSFASTAGSLDVDTELRGTGGMHAAVAVVEAGADLPESWFKTCSRLEATAPTSPALQPFLESSVAISCASGDYVRIATGSTRGILLFYRSSSSISADPEELEKLEPATFNALMCGTQPVDFDDSGLVLPFLSLRGIHRGVWLRNDDQERVLRALHGLASRNGVAHNIPLPAAPSQKAPRPSRSRADSASSGASVLDPQADGMGLVTGYFLPPDWADLTDCMICLGSLGECTWLRGAPLRTGCGHLFHTMCLRKHLRGGHSDSASQVCPNCRATTPFQGATSLGGSGCFRWKASKDAHGQTLHGDRCYSIVAVLCQDPQAVVDSAAIVACATLMPGDRIPEEAVPCLAGPKTSPSVANEGPCIGSTTLSL